LKVCGKGVGFFGTLGLSGSGFTRPRWRGRRRRQPPDSIVLAAHNHLAVPFDPRLAPVMTAASSLVQGLRHPLPLFLAAQHLPPLHSRRLLHPQVPTPTGARASPHRQSTPAVVRRYPRARLCATVASCGCVRLLFKARHETSSCIVHFAFHNAIASAIA